MQKLIKWPTLSLMLALAVACVVSCGKLSVPESETLEPYKVGITGAVTGFGAVSYLPVIDGLRLYVESLNDAGGVNRRKIKLYIENDEGVPSRAAANTKKLVADGVQMMVVNTFAPAYAVTLAECEKANLLHYRPMFGGEEVMPPNPHRLVFGRINGIKDAPVGAVKALRAYEPGRIKLALMAMDHPMVTVAANNMKAAAEGLGMEVVLERVPMAVADMTPIAMKFKDAGCNWLYYYGAGGLGAQCWQALQNLGWEGKYYVLGSTEPPDTPSGLQLFRASPGRVVTHLTNPSYNALATKDLRDAVEKYGATYQSSLMMNGWALGEEIKAVYKEVGWPVTTEKLVNAFENLYIERDKRQGSWYTPKSHQLVWCHFAVFRYDPAKDDLVQASNWVAFDPLGQHAFEVGPEVKSLKSYGLPEYLK